MCQEILLPGSNETSRKGSECTLLFTWSMCQWGGSARSFLCDFEGGFYFQVESGGTIFWSSGDTKAFLRGVQGIGQGVSHVPPEFLTRYRQRNQFDHRRCVQTTLYCVSYRSYRSCRSNKMELR